MCCTMCTYVQLVLYCILYIHKAVGLRCKGQAKKKKKNAGKVYTYKTSKIHHTSIELVALATQGRAGLQQDDTSTLGHSGWGAGTKFCQSAWQPI